MSETYDGIILGAGHNSLILQSYLGMAGVSTVCLELRREAGGGLTTVEDPRHPGFLHNTHSFFHRGMTSMPWYHDLNLERLGARYLQPELNVAMIQDDGRVLEWWTDIERTIDSVGQFSAKDAAAVRRWHDDFVPVVRNIVVPESSAPPLERQRRVELLSHSAEGRLLLKTSEMSPLEFVTTEFENPVVQAGMLFFNGLREVDPRARGFGHHIPSLLASDSKAQMCIGGSAALARALETAVRDTGGVIRVGVEPERIVVENGRAVGVVTTSGEQISARRFVASSLNPHQTFLDLLDDHVLPSGWRSRAESFRFNLIAPLFALNLNLTEPPRYLAAESRPHLNHALMVILGLQGIGRYDDIVRHHENGTIPPTVMWGSCPTVFDPSQAPSGHHTAFMWEKLPYRLRGDPRSWDSEKHRHGDAMLRLWSQYAPNLNDSVLDMMVRSPLDTERTFPNMKGGDLLVGAFTNDQVGYHRPFLGAGDYRGPIAGLYLCGSSSHPGGNITGLPGYNCAQVILQDLDLPASWAPTSLERRLADLR